ncbi:hypothetical protein Vau01_111370 [Virgisporangium aurantiacum]|uniref:Uncharacterized protein n=1 Tax=Virgisporangium aurantiacum TaxID=175570 RepID=A0A8J3ZLE3_9ACTN|nr:hypothetical protein Vau01_111370 [Virgisporangium aurantiacum]
MRFAPWFAACFIAAGPTLTAVAVMLSVDENTEAGLAVLLFGVVLTLFGGLYVGSLPYAVVSESSVVVRTGNERQVPAYLAFARRDDRDHTSAARGVRRVVRPLACVLVVALSTAGCGDEPKEPNASTAGGSPASTAASSTASATSSPSPSLPPSPSPTPKRCPWSEQNPRPLGDDGISVTLDTTCLGDGHRWSTGGWLYVLPSPRTTARNNTFDNGLVLPMECAVRNGPPFSDIDGHSSPVWVRVRGVILNQFTAKGYAQHAAIGYADITDQPECVQ